VRAGDGAGDGRVSSGTSTRGWWPVVAGVVWVWVAGVEDTS
jgi:hypothetical protein